MSDKLQKKSGTSETRRGRADSAPGAAPPMATRGKKKAEKKEDRGSGSAAAVGKSSGNFSLKISCFLKNLFLREFAMENYICVSFNLSLKQCKSNYINNDSSKSSCFLENLYPREFAKENNFFVSFYLSLKHCKSINRILQENKNLKILLFTLEIILKLKINLILETAIFLPDGEVRVVGEITQTETMDGNASDLNVVGEVEGRVGSPWVMDGILVPIDKAADLEMNTDAPSQDEVDTEGSAAVVGGGEAPNPSLLNAIRETTDKVVQPPVEVDREEEVDLSSLRGEIERVEQDARNNLNNADGSLGGDGVGGGKR